MEQILEFSNKMLLVFSSLVLRFNLVEKVYSKYPNIKEVFDTSTMTFLITILLGLTIITAIFFVLIRLCKMSLNFIIFLRWASLVVLGIGIIGNLT